MIQTGGAENRGAYTEGADVSAYRYTLPAEIDTAFFHRKGAVAAARMGDNVNPLQKLIGNTILHCSGKGMGCRGSGHTGAESLQLAETEPLFQVYE
jgi:peptidylprolyl isomerase